MDIFTFINQFNLQDSHIENIGYEFFKEQIVITINLNNYVQFNYDKGDPESILGNFIFEIASEIKIEPNSFKLKSNKILDVKVLKVNDVSDAISIVFLADVGLVELFFKAKKVEWEPINPYI